MVSNSGVEANRAALLRVVAAALDVDLDLNCRGPLSSICMSVLGHRWARADLISSWLLASESVAEEVVGPEALRRILRLFPVGDFSHIA